MENNYKNLLIDKDVYAVIGINKYIKDYEYIYIPIDTGDIEKSKVYEFEIKPQGKTNTIQFKDFIKMMTQERKVCETLYISYDIQNIALIKEKYGIPCCLINTHINDVINIEPEHEVSKDSMKKLEKILAKKKD